MDAVTLFIAIMAAFSSNNQIIGEPSKLGFSSTVQCKQDGQDYEEFPVVIDSRMLPFFFWLMQQQQYKSNFILSSWLFITQRESISYYNSQILMEPNQPNQQSQDQKSKSPFSGLSGSLFNNNNKTGQGQQGQKQESKGFPLSGGLFSPHTTPQFGSTGDNKSSNPFGNPGSSTPNIFSAPAGAGLFDGQKKTFPLSDPKAETKGPSPSPFFGAPQPKDTSKDQPQNDTQKGNQFLGLSGTPAASSNPLQGVFDSASKNIFGGGSSLTAGLFDKKTQKKAEEPLKPKQQKKSQPEAQVKPSTMPSVPLFGQGSTTPNVFGNPPSTQPFSPFGNKPTFGSFTDPKPTATMEPKAPVVDMSVKQKEKVPQAPSEPKQNLFASMVLPKKTENKDTGLKFGKMQGFTPKQEGQKLEGSAKDSGHGQPKPISEPVSVGSSGKNSEKLPPIPKQFNFVSPPKSIISVSVSQAMPQRPMEIPQTEGPSPNLQVVGKKIPINESLAPKEPEIVQQPLSPTGPKFLTQPQNQFDKSPQFKMKSPEQDPQSQPQAQTQPQPTVDLSRPPIPSSPKKSSAFKPTFELNAGKPPLGDGNQRKRFPTFDEKSGDDMFALKANPPQRERTPEQYFTLQKLSEILSTEAESFVTKNCHKIEASFRKYLAIQPAQQNHPTVYQPMKFIPEIEPNEGANKFLNDFALVIAKIFQIPQNCFQAYGELFHAMIKQMKLDEKFFFGIRLKEDYFRRSKMYSDNMELILEDKQASELVCEFIKYYSTLVTACLKKIQNFGKSMKGTQIYDVFLETSIFINLRSPPTENPIKIIADAMKANDLRLMSHLTKILYNIIELQHNSQTNLDYISKQCVLRMIPIVDRLSVCPSSKIFQKVILKQLNLDKFPRERNDQLVAQLAKTKSLAFMPFLAILNRLDRSRKRINPYPKDLFGQIEGPEWADWLSLYLGEDNIRLEQRQMQYLIKSLKSMQIKNIDKVLSKQSQINRLISLMLQENKLKNFYSAVSALITNSESITKIEQKYFKENTNISNDLRILADQIRKFPNCQFSEEDIPDLEGRAIFLLTVLSVLPDKAFYLENSLFDTEGFIGLNSERCDRVCHLVIDILAYFSMKDFNQEIVVKAFEAITAMHQAESTRKYMDLAMNVNRPQMQFMNKNVSRQISKKVQKLLIHLISTDEFYNSARTTYRSQELSRAYTIRYEISKYIDMVEGVSSSIPFYWFQNCLKVSVKQPYNPELLELMLSKLKIHANKGKALESPLVLSAIIQACNSANFWKQFESKLSASTFLMSDKFSTFNTYLSEEFDLMALMMVFNSLNLLKTMLELRVIRNRSQKLYPSHFICKLLSSLHCLNELDRQYMQVSSQFELASSRSVPSIVGLLSLLSEDSLYINITSMIKKQFQWYYDSNVDIDLESLKKIIKEEGEIIDYSVLRDFLVHPFNCYMDCFENIPSLGIYCANEIIKELKDISIEGLFYMSIPRNVSNNVIDNFMAYRGVFIKNFSRALDSDEPTLSRNCWNLLITLRNSSQNKKIALEIFQNYQRLKGDLTKRALKLPLMLQFILSEARDQAYDYPETIAEIIEILSSRRMEEVVSIVSMIEDYEKTSMTLANFHQFQRLIEEKKIIKVIESFEAYNALTELILRQIYSNHPQATRHCLLFMQLMSKSKFLDAFNKWQKNSKIVDRSLICNKNVPRLYGQDVLELFLTFPEYSRQDLVEVQLHNAVNYFSDKIDQMLNKTLQFLSIIVSIDGNYYANHSTKLKTKKKSQLFCQLHLQPTKFKAFQFFGQNQKDAMNQVRYLIQFFLERIDKGRKFNLLPDVIRTYEMLDLLLNWFRDCKAANKAEVATEAENIFNVCFSELGYPILEPNYAKLLLTCTKILESELRNDTATRLKQAITLSLKSSAEGSPDIKQELLTLFIIVPPTQDEPQLLEMIANLWFTEQNNQYFYNESRVMYKLCEARPFEMAKLKILSKCQRIAKFQDSTLQGARYANEMRTNEAKDWLWILKIVRVLLENGMQSTLVVDEVTKFMEMNKKRIVFTLNECKQDLNLKTKLKQKSIRTTLAQLDELEATLQLFVVLSQCKMWIEMNRQYFEQLLYYLMHMTIFLFAPDSMGEKRHKRYIPQSLSEKIMWQLEPGLRPTRPEDAKFQEGYDVDHMEEEHMAEVIDYISYRPSVFILSMSLRYNQCLKLWLLACSNGMRNSCFVREYFSRPIVVDARGNGLKYSLSHWGHLDKAIEEVIKKLTNRVSDWGKWQDKNQLLGLLNDSFNSPEFFSEAGYTYSLIKFPETEDELISELGESLALAIEMGACHLVSKIYYRNKNGTFSRQSLQGFHNRLQYEIRVAEEKLIKNKLSRDESFLQHIRAGRQLLSQVKYS